MINQKLLQPPTTPKLLPSTVTKATIATSESDRIVLKDRLKKTTRIRYVVEDLPLY